jgi:hypothetical protein
VLSRLKARQIIGGSDPGRQLNVGEIGVTEDGRWYGRDYRGAVTLLNTSTAKGAAPVGGSTGSGISGAWGALSGIVRVLSGRLQGNSTTDHLPEGANLYFTEARARAAVQLYRGTATSGSGTAYTVATTPSFAAHADKLLVLWTADAANSTPTPTLSCNGLAARQLTMTNFTNPGVGYLKVGGIYLVAYDGTNNFWQIMTQIGV